MRARQEDLRPAGLAAHVVDIGARPVTLAEGLARQQLVAAHDRLGAAEIDGDIAVFDALAQAVDALAHAILVFVVLQLALRPRHTPHHHLPAGLTGHGAENATEREPENGTDLLEGQWRWQGG